MVTNSRYSLYFHSPTPWLRPVITAWPVRRTFERWVWTNGTEQAGSCFSDLEMTSPLLCVRQNLILELSDNLGSISSEENSTESNSLELGGPSNTSDVTAASSESASSESTETSEASDSTESNQIRAPACVNGTASCESEEYFLQGIGDDGHAAVDHLMVPDDDERELSLRWSLLEALCHISTN